MLIIGTILLLVSACSDDDENTEESSKKDKSPLDSEVNLQKSHPIEGKPLLIVYSKFVIVRYTLLHKVFKYTLIFIGAITALSLFIYLIK